MNYKWNYEPPTQERREAAEALAHEVNIHPALGKLLLDRGITPGILKSANFPGGNDYNKTIIEPHYEEFGW